MMMIIIIIINEHAVKFATKLTHSNKYYMSYFIYLSTGKLRRYILKLALFKFRIVNFLSQNILVRG